MLPIWNFDAFPNAGTQCKCKLLSNEKKWTLSSALTQQERFNHFLGLNNVRKYDWFKVTNHRDFVVEYLKFQLRQSKIVFRLLRGQGSSPPRPHRNHGKNEKELSINVVRSKEAFVFSACFAIRDSNAPPENYSNLLGFFLPAPRLFLSWSLFEVSNVNQIGEVFYRVEQLKWGAPEGKIRITWK